AILAVARTSPLGTSPWRIAASASADMRMRPDAMAMRWVAAFPPTSTMRALPASSRWVSLSDMESGTGQKRTGGCFDVGLSHKAFTDKEGARAAWRKADQIGVAV